MKFRLALAFIALFLSLATSADRPSAHCRGCWLATPETPTIDQSFGVNIHFIDTEAGELKMIADAGFRFVRTDFVWELTERERGRYDFAPYDRLMSALDAHKLRALLILDYGNPLYTKGKSVRTAEARAAFARWAVAAAKHFVGRGVIWEVFNEPNNPIFWPPKPNADEYAALAVELGRAFQRDMPAAQLVGPATAIDIPFLESCFRAGVLPYWSAVSVHPYREGKPELAAAEYAQLREMIIRFSGARTTERMALISSEWGYSSAWRGMNEEKQAVMLARQFLTNAANGIPLSIWYDWRDDGVDPKEPEHHFGLVRYEYRKGQTPVYEPKPAYLAARTLIAHFSGYRFEERLKIGSADDFVLVFVKDGERRIAAWTTSATSQQVTIPETSGQFSITKVTGEDEGRLSANHGLAIKLTNSPVYLARLP